MKIALYLRVSTDSQTVENQQRELTEYANKREWEIIKVFKDEGVSGDSKNRPAFDEMINCALKGQFDGILVFQLSRLGRSLTQIIQTVQDLSNAGVGIHTVTENISTMDSNPYAKLILAVFGALAEIELNLIRERVRAGVKRAQENGVKFGRKHKGFDISEAISLRNQGKSLRQISKVLDISKSTLANRFKELDLSIKSPSENSSISSINLSNNCVQQTRVSGTENKEVQKDD